MLNFEEDKLVKELKERKPKRVLVQLPEGVKIMATEISKIFTDLGIEVVFSGETAWGGCCIAVEEAKKIGADLIVHFGHAEFIKSEFPILYIEVRDELDLNSLLEKSLELLKNFDKIALAYSIQHRHDVEKVLEFYKENGKEIVLPNKEGYAAYSGHVVGCEYRGLKAIEDDVDAFLVLGNQFHSMGASLFVNKPVFLLDVYNDEVSDQSPVRDKIVKQRAIAIDKTKEAKKIGVIQEIKLGQNFGPARLIKEKLEKQGKEVIWITMSEFTPDKIANFYNIDAFVELACPRIAIDDFAKYPKPILTYKEALVVVGEKSWEDLLEEGFW